MKLDELEKDVAHFSEDRGLDFDTGEVNEFAKEVGKLIHYVRKLGRVAEAARQERLVHRQFCHDMTCYICCKKDDLEEALADLGDE